ncbi:MAG: homoserine dehydrogenase, partial [Crenarchaeota archaeon]|nr:homoserine dehydrogenase [Thermoproteota archaeon]
GKVGQSLASMLEMRSAELREAYGLDLKVVAIVDRKGTAVSKKGVDISKALKVKRLKGSVSDMKGYGKPYLSALEALEEVDGDIVIEVTSTSLETGEPGLTHIMKALSLGRHVVTTNKGPLALSFSGLVDLAHKNGVSLRFSGSVGGAMPILEFAKRCLYGDKIESVRGVLNGTTNYILWSMSEKRLNLSEAVRKAQELGYAEENVLYDLEGLDTACKLVILANWAMGHKVSLRDVEVKGIRGVTLKDILDAEREGFAIKLIGSINRGIKVSPRRIPLKDPLCVDSAFNAVDFTCAYSGQHILIGRGAGGKETASSIIRDIVNVHRESNLSSPSKTFSELCVSDGRPTWCFVP